MASLRPLFLAAALAVAPACVSTVPILGAGPGRPGDPWLFDDAVRGANAAGYHDVASDPEHGRFEVVARADRTGATRFVVQCFSDGWISIVVTGPRVHREGDHLVLHPRVRAEYTAFAEELGEALTVSR